MFKSMIVTILGLALVGCGDETIINPEKIVEKEVEVEIEIKQDFERVWFCDNNSRLELVVDSLDRVGFETTGQTLNSINPQNDTIGTHPTIGDRRLDVISGKVFLSKNYNYSSSTHDIENDLTGADINGSKRTDITLELDSDKNLKVKIEIYANPINQNINYIWATREWTCQ